MYSSDVICQHNLSLRHNVSLRHDMVGASGGAIYLVGGITLNDSSFVTNTAGEGGAAITSVSLSSWIEFGNVSFQNNAPYCPIGEYGDTRIDVVRVVGSNQLV